MPVRHPICAAPATGLERQTHRSILDHGQTGGCYGLTDAA